MRKEIRRVDPERGICQITSPDERFYSRIERDEKTGLDRVVFRPSVTWICDTYPKGKRFENWLKTNGTEADEIKRLAGERGTIVHQAVAHLNSGETFNITDQFEDPESGISRSLDGDEVAAVVSYVDWWESEGRLKYRILRHEFTTWPDAEALAAKHNLPADCFRWAGTIDMEVLRLEDQKRGIIDIKTPLNIYMSHRLQVSAYRVSEGADWAAILQLDYSRNKHKKWKLTEVPDKFRIFCATMEIWREEMDSIAPLQRDFPLSLSLNLEKGEAKV